MKPTEIAKLFINSKEEDPKKRIEEISKKTGLKQSWIVKSLRLFK